MEDRDYYARTKKIIPDCVQTLSKRNSVHTDNYPRFIEFGKGCKVESVKKMHDSGSATLQTHIDYPCGLGAILLGYSDLDVNEAVIKRIKYGTLFSLPNRLETELAEEIKKLVPSMEMMRFVKTGSEACSAAVKLGRAYTKKNGVAIFGYGGWHDWFTINTPKKKGIPREYQNYIASFEYNNLESLREIFSLSKSCLTEVGVVIMEPYVYDAPDAGFLQAVIDLAHSNGAVVIFDETVTGMRTKNYTAQGYYGVTPDLTVLGKALGNGFPIAVVGGKEEIMKELEGDCFVSSTFGGDLVGISAALAVLKKLQKEPVLDHIWDMGTKLRDGFNELARKNNLFDVNAIGHPCRLFFNFPSNRHKGLFWQECIKRGVLFGYATFINYAHQLEDIEKTLDAIDESLAIVKENYDFPENVLVGEPPIETQRMLAAKR